MADIPHLALPLRYVGGKPVVVEQDTLEDIVDCVEAILRTVFGEREEVPDFGRPDYTLDQQPLNTAELSLLVTEQEPRATILITQHPDLWESLVADITVKVSTKEFSLG